MDIASQFKVNESMNKTIRGKKQKVQDSLKVASEARGEEDRQAAVHYASNKVKRQVAEAVSIAQRIPVFDCVTA